MTVRKFRITVNGKIYEVEAEEVMEQPDRTAPPVARLEEGRRLPETTEKKPVPPQPQTRVSDAGEPVTAPLPGMVLDVKVTEGHPVTAGQVVVVLEAMKMENEVVAPIAGIVRSLAVQKGSAVNAGDALLTIHPQ